MHKKVAAALYIILDIVLSHKAVAVLLVTGISGAVLLRTSALASPAAATQRTEAAVPQTFTLSRTDLAVTVTGQGTLQGSTVVDVGTSQTAAVAAVYVAEGEYVSAGQVLCHLETEKTEPAANTAEIQLKIEQAEAEDALELSQALRKLAEAEELLAIEGQAAEQTMQDAAYRLEEAKVATANQMADATVDKDPYNAAIVNEEITRKAFEGATNPADMEQKYIEWTEALILMETLAIQYETARQQAYDAAYPDARPSPQWENYNKAVAAYEKTLYICRVNVEEARDEVNALLQTDSAAAARLQLDGHAPTPSPAEIPVTAPVSGTITSVSAAVGLSAKNARLFTIQNTSGLLVQADIPAADALLLHTEMPVEVAQIGSNGQSWTGTLAAISLPASEADGSARISVKLPAQYGSIAASASVSLTISVDDRPQVYAVPHSAVVENEQGQPVVYQWLSGTERRAIPVTTGLAVGDVLEISGAGLQEGMVLCTEPRPYTAVENPFLSLEMA